MVSKKAIEPAYQQMGKLCANYGWKAEIVTTREDVSQTVACANCFFDKTVDCGVNVHD